MVDFQNPILGGTALVRPAIKSPDYQAGTTGWSINQDGSAEFNNLTARGTLALPNNTPNTTRMVIGTAIPAVLTPMTNAYPPSFNNYHAIAAQIWYLGGGVNDPFYFQALLDLNPAQWITGWAGGTAAGSVVQVINQIFLSSPLNNTVQTQVNKFFQQISVVDVENGQGGTQIQPWMLVSYDKYYPGDQYMGLGVTSGMQTAGGEFLFFNRLSPWGWIVQFTSAAWAGNRVIPGVIGVVDTVATNVAMLHQRVYGCNGACLVQTPAAGQQIDLFVQSCLAGAAKAPATDPVISTACVAPAVAGQVVTLQWCNTGWSPTADHDYDVYLSGVSSAGTAVAVKNVAGAGGPTPPFTVMLEDIGNTNAF